MQYGSLEWANDLLNSTKAELDKINAADDKGKAAAAELGITEYYTNLIKALEDEIAKGNYAPEAEMPAKDTSDDEDFDNDVESEWTFIYGTDAAAVYEKDGKYKVEGDNTNTVTFDNEEDAKDFAVTVSDTDYGDDDGDDEDLSPVVKATNNNDDDDVTQNLIKGIKFGQYDK